MSTPTLRPRSRTRTHARPFTRPPRTRRHINLALLQHYGSNAWRIHNYLNEATAQNIEKALEELKNLTTEVNCERKNFQVGVPYVRRADWKTGTDRRLGDRRGWGRS